MARRSATSVSVARGLRPFAAPRSSSAAQRPAALTTAGAAFLVGGPAAGGLDDSGRAVCGEPLAGVGDRRTGAGRELGADRGPARHRVTSRAVTRAGGGRGSRRPSGLAAPRGAAQALTRDAAAGARGALPAAGVTGRGGRERG